MAIQDMMEYDTIIPFEKTINENIKPDQNTILREEQDREYRECLEIDEKVKEVSTKEVSTKEIFEELSPMSLRQKRLAFYQ